MLWHIVRFQFSDDVDDGERRALEHDIAALAGTIDEVAWLAVARDVDEPAVTGLLTLFHDAGALATYREHPRHVPVVERARALCESISRVDMQAGVPPPRDPAVK